MGDNTRSDMALVGGADGQAVDIEKHCLNLTPSKGAPPEAGSKEHEAMGDLATLTPPQRFQHPTWHSQGALKCLETRELCAIDHKAGRGDGRRPVLCLHWERLSRRFPCSR